MIEELIEMNNTLMCLIEHSNALDMCVEQLLKEKGKVDTTRVISREPYIVVIKYANGEVYAYEYAEGMKVNKIERKGKSYERN